MSTLNLSTVQQGIAGGQLPHENVTRLGRFVGKKPSDVEVMACFLEERRQGPLRRQGLSFVIEFAVEAPILAFIRSRASRDATLRQLLRWLRIGRRLRSETSLVMPLWAWFSMLTLSRLERWEVAAEAKEQNYEVYKRCVMTSMYVTDMVNNMPLEEKARSFYLESVQDYEALACW